VLALAAAYPRSLVEWMRCRLFVVTAVAIGAVIGKSEELPPPSRFIHLGCIGVVHAPTVRSLSFHF